MILVTNTTGVYSPGILALGKAALVHYLIASADVQSGRRFPASKRTGERTSADCVCGRRTRMYAERFVRSIKEDASTE
jgi:hypothetical protein